jgi:DNA-binding Xre family transcriptional regulator
MEMRLRFPELFAEHDTSPWRVAQASNGRVNASVLYRLRARGGRVRYIDAELLDVLCDVLGVGPEKLLERDKAAKRKR